MPPDTLILATNPTGTDWAIATMILGAGVVVILLMRPIVRILARHVRVQEYAVRLIARAVGTGVMVLCVVYALRQLHVAIGPLIGALGVTGIVIALALQPVMGNLVAAIMLHARRPIRLGDQIESHEHRGTVLEINSRAVVMLSFDGEVVFLPNLNVLDGPLVNRTREEYRRTTVPFQVGYDADLRHVQRVLTSAIRTVDALGDTALPTDVLVVGFADSGVDMIARFWHPSEELSAWHAISEVSITIRETLRDEAITIPFPQRVLHFSETEAHTAAEPLPPSRL